MHSSETTSPAAKDFFRQPRDAIETFYNGCWRPSGTVLSFHQIKPFKLFFTSRYYYLISCVSQQWPHIGEVSLNPRENSQSMSTFAKWALDLRQTTSLSFIQVYASQNRKQKPFWHFLSRIWQYRHLVHTLGLENVTIRSADCPRMDGDNRSRDAPSKLCDCKEDLSN